MKKILFPLFCFASVASAQVKAGMEVSTLSAKTQVQLEQMAIAIQKQQALLNADRKKIQAIIEIKRIEATPTPTVNPTPTP